MIDEKIYTTKIQLYRLRNILLTEQEGCGISTAKNELDPEKPQELATRSSVIVGGHTATNKLSTELASVVAAGGNKSWIEFEKQFFSDTTTECQDEPAEHSLYNYDWSVEEASDILSVDVGAFNGLTNSVGETAAGSKNDVSRFYTKRQIIVGNTSQYLKKGARETGNPATHKWMVYVRSGPTEPPLHTFVKSVSFFLHPTYSPNDIIVLGKPPFQLTRLGWGEFPVRIQLHFKDSAHKPIDILHGLKLDSTHTGQQMLGNETAVDIDLVKYNDTDPYHCVDNNKNEKDSVNEEAMETSPNSQNTAQGTTFSSSIAPNDIAIWQILQCLAKKMPLFGRDTLICYGARTVQEFTGWNIVKQRAIEWMRAIDMKKYIRKVKVPRSDQLTTREIVDWCRVNGHTPHPSHHDDRAVCCNHVYCKHCGKQHEQKNNFGCNCVTLTPSRQSSVLDILTTSNNYNKVKLPQEFANFINTPSGDGEDLPQYRVPRSPELKWIHQACLQIGIQLYPQFHDGMLLHVTDHMIFSASTQFVYQLLKAVVTLETNSFDWTNERIIVPNLICSAIKENLEFDFLTERGLSLM